MESLPPALLDFISAFRPLMRAEVFDSFTYLLCGLLIGEAKHGTVRTRMRVQRLRVRISKPGRYSEKASGRSSYSKVMETKNSVPRTPA
jgi:hypothetical protein